MLNDERPIEASGHEDEVHELNSRKNRVLGDIVFSSRRRHTRFDCDWSSDVCSSDLFLDFAARWVEWQAFRKFGSAIEMRANIDGPGCLAESRATRAYFRVTESSGRKPWRRSAAARVATVRLVKGAKNLWVNWYRPLRAATG